MNSKQIAALIAAVIVVVGGFLIYNHNHKSNNSGSTYSNSTNSSNASNTSSNTAPAASSSSSSSSGSASSGTSSVTISNFAFSPASLTVKKGTKVTWTNNDSTTHHVVETDSNTGPDSGNLSPDSSYSFTYNTAGSFHYHCSIHPEMTGTITVTD